MKTRVTGVSFDKLVGKLKGKDIVSLVLLFGETKIKNDLGVINLSPPLEKMHNLEVLTLDLYKTKITDQPLYRIAFSLAKLTKLRELTISVGKTKIQDDDGCIMLGDNLRYL